MESTHALLFTAYMIPVGFFDNVFRPVVMARGLVTPMPVILIGVIGGTIAYGISRLFLGPIILSVASGAPGALGRGPKSSIDRRSASGRPGTNLARRGASDSGRSDASGQPGTCAEP